MIWPWTKKPVPSPIGANQPRVFTATIALRGISRESLEWGLREQLGSTGRGTRIVVEEGETAFIEAAARVGPA